MGLSDEEMAQKKIFKIHQDFRIVALAEPPSAPGKPYRLWTFIKWLILIARMNYRESIESVDDA